MELVLAAGQNGNKGQRDTYTNIWGTGSAWVYQGQPPHIVSQPK